MAATPSAFSMSSLVKRERPPVTVAVAALGGCTQEKGKNFLGQY